jgi:hypothetical protein
MTVVYCRCNGGDYFVGEYCPFDGWSSADSKAIAAAARSLADAGHTPSIQALRAAGLGEQTLARALVIDFGAETSAFEAMSPRTCIIDGRVIPYTDLDANLL